MDKRTLEKTEGAIKNGQSNASGNTWYTGHKTKTNKRLKHNIGLILKSSVLCAILTYFH